MADIRAFPSTFIVQRDQDVTGISGEGIVAEGVRFSDGWAVTHWLDRPPMNEPKTEVWHNPGTEPFEKISGHGGRTRIVWADEEQAHGKLAADVAEAFDVPGWVVGPEGEREVLRRRIGRAIQSVQDGEAAPVEVGDERIVQAVMPVIERLLTQRDRAQAAAGRAYQLADRWEAASGSFMFPVRVAGAELRDELDDSAVVDGEVVHPKPTAQVSASQKVGENSLVPTTVMDSIRRAEAERDVTVAAMDRRIKAADIERLLIDQGHVLSAFEADEWDPGFRVIQAGPRQVNVFYDGPGEADRLADITTELCAQGLHVVANQQDRGGRRRLEVARP